MPTKQGTLSAGAFVLLFISATFVIWLTARACAWVVGPHRVSLAARTADFFIRPTRGGSAYMALDEDASVALAGLRVDPDSEPARARLIELTAAGRIVGVEKNENVLVLELFVVKDGQVRKDALLGERLDPGEVVMARIQVSSGARKGLTGWLPRQDLGW